MSHTTPTNISELKTNLAAEIKNDPPQKISGNILQTDLNDMIDVLSANSRITTGLYTCSTAAATATKAVTIPDYVMEAGGAFKVKFTYANSAANPVLKINTENSHAIVFNGAVASATNTWGAGEVVEFYYDPTYNSNAGGFIGRSTVVSVSQNTETGYMAGGAKVGTITIGSAQTPLYSHCVPLKAIVASSSQLPSDTAIGDVWFSTYLHSLMIIDGGTAGSWSSAAFQINDGAIYTYGGHLYTLIDNNLVRVDNDKQASLISGSNIKTINGESLLGSGNISLNVNDILKSYDKTILTEHGYYSKDDGIFHESTQNYYSAVISVEGYTSIMLKGAHNNLAYECCCLFNGTTFVAGLDVFDSYNIIQIPLGVTTIKVTFVPYDAVSIILSKIQLTNDKEIAFFNAKETRMAQTLSWIDNKRVAITGNVGDTATISVGANSNCKYIMMSVSKGDIFDITSRMLAGVSVALLDKDNKILYKSGDSEQFYNYHLIVEQSGTLIVNTYKTYPNEVIYYKDFEPLRNKTIALFGDSISEFKDSSGRGIAEYIEEQTNSKVIRCGIGGLCLCVRESTIPPIEDITISAECYDYLDLAHSIPKIVTGDMTDINAVWQKLQDDFSFTPTPEQVLAMYNWNHIDFNKVDIVIISAGTNDSRYCPLGTEDSINPHAYMGAVNIIVNALLTAYPHLSLYFFTPIVKKIDNTYWCDEYTADSPGMNGLKLSQVCEGIVNICTLNHIPVCNMYKEMGWTKYNFSHYCTDGTHPENGYRQMADKYVSFIESNITF